MREIADKFKRTISRVWNIIEKLTTVIENHQHMFIKCPAPSQGPSIARNFASIAGFPNVLGAIDGSHIRIKPPPNHKKECINRKWCTSFNILAVCLPNKQFSYTFVGFPGIAHDARVYRNSGLALQSNIDSMYPNDTYHIIGDSAYRCLVNLMPAFKDSLAKTAEKEKYNKKLSKTRVIIENAFVDLKNRWRDSISFQKK